MHTIKSTPILLILLLLLPNGFADEAKSSDIDPQIKKKVKKSVDHGLLFLRSTQTPEGHWGHPGITALAAIAFMKSPRKYSDEDGPFIRRPIEFLLSIQKEDGGVYKKTLPNYNTSVALLAFLEAKKVFKNPELLARIDKAIPRAKKFLRGIQVDEQEGYTSKDKFYGGVGYGGDQRPDMSNIQLSIEAMRKAGVPEDDPFFQKALQFLQRCQNRSESNDQKWARGGSEDGGFVYYPGNSPAGKEKKPDGTTAFTSYGSMTYAGIKSFIYAGVDRKDPRVEAAVNWIQKHYSITENPNMGTQGLYYYYHTFAKALRVYDIDTITDSNGKTHNWRNELCDHLLSLQNTDENSDGFGSWKNDNPRWWEGDPTLATIYAVLTLNHCYE